MAAYTQFTLLCLGCFLSSAAAANVSPIEKVLQLMDDLTAKITAEGEAEAKAYAEYVE